MELKPPILPVASPLISPKVRRESLTDRFKRYYDYFEVPLGGLKKMYRSCSEELRRGLEMHKTSPHKWNPDMCSLMALDTCVKVVPTGNEKGVYYGVDFGGTNVRAVRVVLEGNGKTSSTQVKANMRSDETAAPHLPKGLLDKDATATMLFDFIANQIKRLMEEHGDLNREEPMNIGLTFSFAMEQRRLNNAKLLSWSKNFSTGEATNDAVVRRDVCSLLDVALERHNVPAKVVAALNDTTGTLLSAAYERPRSFPPCVVGVILGTGLNAAYYQPNADDWGYIGNIINTECGGFDKELPTNIVDSEVDFSTVNRGKQKLEKMMSGLYLPELCRRTFIKIFQSQAPQEAWTHHSMPGEACGAIISDSTPDLSQTKTVLKTMWEWSPSHEHAEMIQSLFTKIYQRSSHLAAVIIAAMAKQTGRLQRAMGGLTVAVDGSLYTQNDQYRYNLMKCLNDILGEEIAQLIRFTVADDGSGKGAAILAAKA